MLSEAKHPGYWFSERAQKIDLRFFASLRMTNRRKLNEESRVPKLSGESCAILR